MIKIEPLISRSGGLSFRIGSKTINPYRKITDMQKFFCEFLSRLFTVEVGDQMIANGNGKYRF
jgi:hypothetical protein